jgi:predicted dehydrogenase
VHEIDYAGWLFGWPSSLQGKLRNLGVLGIQAEESANLTWETETGCHLSIGLDYLSRPAIRGIVARGGRGTLRWDGITGDALLSTNSKAPKEIGSTQTMRQMYSAQAQAFASACRGDSDGPLATGEDGARALAVCDAARIASRDRKETAVNYS